MNVRRYEPTLMHFKPEEFGEGWGRLDPILLFALDGLRSFIDVPIIIHTDGIVDAREASTDSQHPKGRAVDCHAIGIALLDFWLAAERLAQFRGIGIYPFWKTPGLHLDTRPEETRARWWKDAAGVYQVVDATALIRMVSHV